MTEYEKFIQWLRQTYGGSTRGLTPANYKEHPGFNFWRQSQPSTPSFSDRLSEEARRATAPSWLSDLRGRLPQATGRTGERAFTRDIGEEEFYQKPDISWKPFGSPDQWKSFDSSGRPAFDFNIQEEPTYQKPESDKKKFGDYLETEGGYDVIATYDVNGDRSITKVIGRTKSVSGDELTDRERFEWEKQKWAEQTQQKNLQRQSTERQLREAEETIFEMRKAWANPQNFLPMMASTYDEWKGRMLNSLAGPRNWLMKRDLETRANPYISALGAGQDTVGMGMARLNTPVPQGLANFVPSLRGQSAFNIKDESLGPAEAPSGQMWTAASPTQREYLKGYMDWVGQNVGDTLAYSQSMAPETPNIAGGWKPKRQY